MDKYIKKLILLIILLNFSCERTDNASPALEYEFRSIDYQSPNCEPEHDPCLMVKMAYPFFMIGDSAARAQANMIIRNSTLDFIGMGDVEAKTSPEIEEAVIALDSSFQRLKIEFGSPAGWMAELHTSEVYRNDSLVVLEVTSANYFGGAHGQYNTRYFNFDRRSGKLVKLEDFVELTSFTQTAEKYFSDKFVEEGETYVDAGFDFYEGKFRLAANFAFKGDSILLHYNHYEIASYAAGQFDVAVPIAK